MPSFEEKLTALELVVDRLERGELSLDDSVRLFEEGITLSNACKVELEKAEGRIQILAETQGQGRTEDFADANVDDDDPEETEGQE